MKYATLYKVHALCTILGVACFISALITHLNPWYQVSFSASLPVSFWLLTQWTRGHVLGKVPEIRLMCFTLYPSRYIAQMDTHALWMLMATLGLVAYGCLRNVVALAIMAGIQYALMCVVVRSEREMYEAKRDAYHD